MTGRETCSSSSSHPQVRNTAPRSGLSPLRYGLCHPALRAPLARLSGFLFVLFLYEGLAPLAITMPPRNARGSHLAAAPAAGKFLPACKASEVTEGAEFRSAGAAA